MMGRKLGAKQNAKERSPERGRDERRETRQRGRDGTRRMHERKNVSIFYLCARLSSENARMAVLALAVIWKTASRYCCRSESRKFITQSNGETSSVVGSNEVLTSV